MRACVPNPEYAEAQYEIELHWADGTSMAYDFKPRRYRTAEDAIKRRNPVPPFLIVDKPPQE